MATLVACQKNKNDKHTKNVDYDIDKILDDLKQPESSPITCCCIMGATNSGKTMLSNCIRGQQIGGATYLPPEKIRQKTMVLKRHPELSITGLLLIDTPPLGHESFNKLLRSSQIAVLVVDIYRGLQPQTIEALDILRSNNINFVVAINKVDSLYGWKTRLIQPYRKAMMLQSKDVQHEFNSRLSQIITQFKDQGFDTELYYKNKHWGETFSIVPTSVISGEGIPELLQLLAQSPYMIIHKNFVFNNDIQCTVLGVNVIEGLGTTIDVELVNGVLHEGDEIVVCGVQGPIHTTIHSLLTPHPTEELGVKGAYIHHKEIEAPLGIKITAQNIEYALEGSPLYVLQHGEDKEPLMINLDCYA